MSMVAMARPAPFTATDTPSSGDEARGDEARGDEARGDEARGDEHRRYTARASFDTPGVQRASVTSVRRAVVPKQPMLPSMPT